LTVCVDSVGNRYLWIDSLYIVNSPLLLDDDTPRLIVGSFVHVAAEAASAAVLSPRLSHVLGAEGSELVLGGVVVELLEVAHPAVDLPGAVDAAGGPRPADLSGEGLQDGYAGQCHGQAGLEATEDERLGDIEGNVGVVDGRERNKPEDADDAGAGEMGIC
jgi:hypothetical protein